MAASDELLTERLLRVIDEGRRVATYKLALLLAMIDVIGATPGVQVIPTRRLAEAVLDIYYPQTRVFIAGNGVQHELKQISAKGSPVLRAALRLRLIGDEGHCRQASDVRRHNLDEYEAAVSLVEDTFVRYPIPLLQVVGAELVPFLYEADWAEGTSARQLRAEGRDRVRLMDGVADRLVVLGPLIRPLIELYWARDVAKWSRIDSDDAQLRDHLFGAPRPAIPLALRRQLVEIADGRCFYCDAPIRKRVEIDHFLARSRWPNDAIENFVVADRCNQHKSDHLAADEHVQRWAAQLPRIAGDLSEIAQQHRWPSAIDRTVGLVTNTYGHLAAETPLWVQGKAFERSSGPINVEVDLTVL